MYKDLYIQGHLTPNVLDLPLLISPGYVTTIYISDGKGRIFLAFLEIFLGFKMLWYISFSYKKSDVYKI